MTTDRIDTSPKAIAKLLEGVTPGPWYVGEDQCVDDVRLIVTTSSPRLNRSKGND